MLGQIPLVQAVCDGGDAGMPVALDDSSVVGKAFDKLAQSVAQQIAIQNATQPKQVQAV